MPKDRQVLVIEDDGDLLLLIKRLLEFNGFKVLTALTGNEGKRKFKKYAKRLSSVILDLSLPDQDGKLICREIRRKFPEMTIIITTGSEDIRQRKELDEIGIQGFLRKPFDLHELVKFVSHPN